jgi:N utilization substance protein B
MQTLYTLAATDAVESDTSKKQNSALLDDKLNRALDIFIASILYTFRVAQFAEKDADYRASKYLPTTEDLKVNTKIAQNEFVLQVSAYPDFAQRVKDLKDRYAAADEWIKKIYQDLEKTPEYLKYVADEVKTAYKEKAIIHFIWEKLILTNEPFQEHLIDEWQGWEDDREMTIMLMDNFFKGDYKTIFPTLLSDEKKEYAHELLHTALEKETYCMELIKPKLYNWDAERVALIDFILLRMGVCEFLYFPTIPTKVTINEYIEIAKVYSTPQSGQFVNGVLDNILKDLEKENKIQKQERIRKP